MPTFSTTWLADRLRQLRHSGGASRYLCALSGGLDSSVLLHAAAAIEGIELRAMHIDHGLSVEAAVWAEHARASCRDLGVPFSLTRVDVADAGNLEEAAREARYAALADLIKPGETLLTAHHQDDQLETVLLQLLRGAGPTGLAAMPQRTRFSCGWHSRPLLTLRRAALREYAAQQRIAFVEDPSNETRRFDRNYLRHEVLPAIRKRWPSAATSVARSAALAANASRLLGDLAAIDARQGLDHAPLDFRGLDPLGAGRYANVVREWLRCQGAQVPNAARLEEFVRQLRSARKDRQPGLDYADWSLRVFRGGLYLGPRTRAISPGWHGRLGAGERLELPGGLGTLRLQPIAGRGLDEGVAKAGLRVAFRIGGEKLRVTPGGATRRVKNLLQENAVLPWMRGRVPMLWAGDRLAAVADLWSSQEMSAASGCQAWAVTWDERPALFAAGPPFG